MNNASKHADRSGRQSLSEQARELTYLVVEPYTDRDRLYIQYELLRGDFSRWFDRALQLGKLSTDPGAADWRALDVGCGEGLFSGEIARKYPHTKIVGFDKDKHAIETANMVFGSEGLHFYVHDVLEPQRERPEESQGQSTKSKGRTTGSAGATNAVGASIGSGEGFDIAFAHFVLMHVRQPSVALANISDVLKPGGVVYVRDSSLEGLPFPHPSLVRLLEVAGHAIQSMTLTNFARHHEEHLREAGFEQIDTGYSVYVVGGPTEEGQRMFNNLVLALKSSRPGLVNALHLISGEEFDEHIRRLTTEVTSDMECKWEIVNSIARKPPV